MKSRTKGNYPKRGFRFGLMEGLLESCGIINVKRIIKGYKDVPFNPDWLNVKGVKCQDGIMRIIQVNTSFAGSVVRKIFHVILLVDSHD
jgi:hypothetical protein